MELDVNIQNIVNIIFLLQMTTNTKYINFIKFHQGKKMLIT